MFLKRKFNRGIAISDQENRHVATWKEEIVKAIVFDGEKTWNRIQQVTGLSDLALKEALDELIELGIIEKRNENYVVNIELWSDFFSEHDYSSRLSKKKNKALLDWINRWLNKERLDFSLEKGHFYLYGKRLYDFSKKIMEQAESEILISNPDVNECPLTDTLKKLSKNGKTVKVITQPPAEESSLHRWHKKECHSSLTEAGITVICNKKINARIIAVDRKVAIISSSNFSHSSVPDFLDSGIISVEETVVDEITNSLLKILESQ